MREVVILRAEIEAARAIIRSNRQDIANIDQLKADAKELAVKNNEALEHATKIDAASKALQKSLMTQHRYSLSLIRK